MLQMAIFACLFVFSDLFLGPYPWHMEVLRLGVISELQPLPYAMNAATRHPSHVFHLHHSSQQHSILNPLSKARDRTCILMDTSRIRFHCATMETPCLWEFIVQLVLHLCVRIYIALSLEIAKGWKKNQKALWQDICELKIRYIRKMEYHAAINKNQLHMNALRRH